MPNEFKYGDITYQDIAPISRQEMKGKSIDIDACINMAKNTQLIPVNAMELRYICTHMPIVFSPVGVPMPIAVAGFEKNKNIFVQNGQWRKNTYVPAAIMRYPFALSDGDDGKRILYIDKQALKDDEESTLFSEDGSNSETLEKAIELCKSYDLYNSSTEKAIKAIEAEDLFIEKQLSFETKTGTKALTGAFKIIDLDKYAQLSDEAVVNLQKNQALWVIHTHIISMDRIVTLAKQSKLSES